MPFITFEKPNLWDEACYEVQTGSPDIPLPPGGFRFNSALFSPVFAGYAFQKIPASDSSLIREFDSAYAHPSTVGFSMTVLTKDDNNSAKTQVDVAQKGKIIPPKDCSAVQYLVDYLFPIVSAALEAMLIQAKSEKCFERKRTKFNACDFLTEYLFKNNPNLSLEEKERRAEISLFEIPFAQEWLLHHPRKPLPLSLIWTETEAATVLQSAWRGYLLRRQPDVSELRRWQREWREENKRTLDGEIDKLFSRAQSQASSGQSPRSRPPSKRSSAQRSRGSRSGTRRHPQSASTGSTNIPNIESASVPAATPNSQLQ